MICFLTDEHTNSFIKATSFDITAGARIFSLYNMFGANYEHAMFWVQINELGVAVAALSRYGGILNISASQNADLAEINEFTEFIGGFERICSSHFVCESLQKSCKCFPVMELADDTKALSNKKICATPKLQDVYSLLCLCDDDFAGQTNWESWYVHTSHLLRHGLGFCAGIYINDTLVSTAGVYAKGTAHAVISGVATLPNFRGKGYASAVINAAAKKSLSESLMPVILSANSKLEKWYETMGFAVAGKFCEASLRELI